MVPSQTNSGISRFFTKCTLHVIKRSLRWNMSTSCPLEPNYSYRAEGSTSNVIYSEHCAAAQRPWARKPCFETRNPPKIMIFMILRPLRSQVAHLSFICPGIKLNQMETGPTPFDGKFDKLSEKMVSSKMNLGITKYLRKTGPYVINLRETRTRKRAGK